MLDPVTKKAPHDLKEKYGDFIRNGDGFAQGYPEHKFFISQYRCGLKFKIGMV
jgi:hypothetical protein